MKWQFLKFPFSEHDDITDAMADQLLLVQYTSLPSDRKIETGGNKPDFVHWSIKEDMQGIRNRDNTEDVVR